jgi:hypothetical protein
MAVFHPHSLAVGALGGILTLWEFETLFWIEFFCSQIEKLA